MLKIILSLDLMSKLYCQVLISMSSREECFIFEIHPKKVLNKNRSPLLFPQQYQGNFPISIYKRASLSSVSIYFADAMWVVEDNDALAEHEFAECP